MTGVEMSMAKFKNSAGFTLIELLVSMAIGLAVIASVAGTFMAQTRQNSAEEQVAQMEQNVRAALDLMVREIQMAKYNPAGTSAFSSAYGVTYSATQLEVKADMDGNGAIDTSSGSVEDIIYAHDATNRYITRKLGSSGTAEIVADNITAFTFNYYDANGSAVTSSANSGNIRKISVSITARTAKPDPSFTSNGGYRTYQLSADITPPNLSL
jgi:prepilin-type N-terminal cleavage/methylation domain-containing protein